ncbi:MerR family transcriptional regulator [Paenibacillus lautus]|uniref:MerR family transcriptional regulator n=1 Tax=Paenibacillus lautus TaxID=1401 RepID=UPI001C3FDD47|nr:helix-turn-helix domain-containing protein [Paenibacillus lautus]
MFTIGEISKLFQIDIRTLRYYDDIDLFKPASVDHLTSYRYYSVDQFEQLNTILYLKALGIPLKDIKHFLDDREIEHILTLLKSSSAEPRRKLRNIKESRRRLKAESLRLKMPRTRKSFTKFGK